MEGITTGEGDVYAGHYHHNYAEKMHHHHDYAERDHDHDEYLEHHDMHDYAKKSHIPTKGTAGAALGLGIAGTALGIWNAWKENNDRRYGKHGRGHGYDDYDDYSYGRGRVPSCDYEENGRWWHREERRERHYEIEKENELATVKAALAQQSADRFSEQGDFKNYKVLSRMIEEENEELAADVKRLSAKVCELEKCCAVAEAKAEGKFEVIKEGLKDFKEDLYGVKAGAKEELRAAISLEAERRECGDKQLHEWTCCNFVKNKKVIPTEDLCPPVMPRFNAFDLDRVEDRRERERKGKE